MGRAEELTGGYHRDKLSTKALEESSEETIHHNNEIAFIKPEVLSQENKLLLW